MEETKKWGGKREGSGRPKKDLGRTYGFRATTQVAAILESLEGRKSDFINEALLEHAKRKGLL